MHICWKTVLNAYQDPENMYRFCPSNSLSRKHSLSNYLETDANYIYHNANYISCF